MREPLKYIKDHFKCLEIGVWKGDFSKHILKKNPDELVLVDPWKFQPQFGKKWYGGLISKNQKDMDLIYESVCSRFSKNNQVKIIRDFSNKVFKKFEDGYFDWIYIDGNHEYDYVLEDLNLWYSKVKPGGYLCGDDYTWKNDNNVETVKMAVQQFMSNIDNEIEISGNQFIIKC